MKSVWLAYFKLSTAKFSGKLKSCGPLRRLKQEDVSMDDFIHQGPLNEKAAYLVVIKNQNYLHLFILTQ